MQSALTLTDILAIVGALTGTLALGWDVFKWWRSEKVKLKITANSGVNYVMDVPLPNVEVTIDNVGGVRTTIHLVSIEIYEGKIREELSAIFHQFTNNRRPLPISLEPGTHWKGILDTNADEVFDVNPNAVAYISVHHSHSNKPIKTKLPKMIRATRC